MLLLDILLCHADSFIVVVMAPGKMAGKLVNSTTNSLPGKSGVYEGQ